MDGNRDRPFVTDDRGLTDVAMKKLSPAHRREPSAGQARRQRRDQTKFEAHRTEDIHDNGSDNPDDYVRCNGFSPVSHSPSPLSRFASVLLRNGMSILIPRRPPNFESFNYGNDFLVFVFGEGTKCFRLEIALGSKTKQRSCQCCVIRCLSNGHHIVSAHYHVESLLLYASRLERLFACFKA